MTSQELVSQVRAGLNNNVTCPKELHLTVTSLQCPPGGVFCSVLTSISHIVDVVYMDVKKVGCWNTMGAFGECP